MLLGAFPIGARSGPAANNKNGKCRFLFLCGGYILFLILGAAMFSAIEAPKIDDISKRVETFRNQFLQNNACLNATFQNAQRDNYKDIDETNQSSDNNTTNACPTHPIQTQTRNPSITEPTNKLTPDSLSANEQTVVSLSRHIGISSICLVRRSCNSLNESLSSSGETNPLRLKYNRKENIWLIYYILLYIIYLLVGGVCFQIIETPIEVDMRSSVEKLRDEFLLKYPQITDEDLEEFLRAIIAANDRGISPLRNASNEMNWSFGQALFFSSTVVTTIGYGHVTPLSQTGKIFCMIYAVIGIPLTLVLLSAVVERLLIPANWLLGTLNSKLGHLYQPFNIRILHLSIVVMLVTILFFAIPTAVFACLEPAWGTLDAFYYCFISLTTIGLGDYIPGAGISVENRSLYKMFITGYLICGLIGMMLVLTIFYDIPQLNLGQLFTESVNGETEKLRLSSNNTTCYSGPSGLYMPQRDEDTRRAVVRIRPHGDDSPSPDEAPPSLNRDMRVP